MTTTTTVQALRSEIPEGGFGRRLTSTEARALRAAGVSVPRGAVVIRAHGLAWRGYLYAPTGNVLSDCGVVVELATK